MPSNGPARRTRRDSFKRTCKAQKVKPGKHLNPAFGEWITGFSLAFVPFGWWPEVFPKGGPTRSLGQSTWPTTRSCSPIFLVPIQCLGFAETLPAAPFKVDSRFPVLSFFSGVLGLELGLAEPASELVVHIKVFYDVGLQARKANLLRWGLSLSFFGRCAGRSGSGLQGRHCQQAGRGAGPPWPHLH